MKFTASILLFLSVSIGAMAQTTISETTTLAIKYLEGQTGNYPNSLFVTGIVTEDDEQSVWGIKPTALYEGCRGEVRITSKEGYKIVVLVREFSTLDEAKQDMNEMIAATRRFFPSLQTQEPQIKPAPNQVEEKVFSDETRGTFISIWAILKQPDAESGKQYKLVTKLQK